MAEIYTDRLPRRLGPYLLLHKTQQGLLSPGFIAAPLEDRGRLLETLLLSCLARNPADRVQTAGALAAALDGLVQAEAITRDQLAQTVCALFPTDAALEEQTITACRSAASEFV